MYLDAQTVLTTAKNSKDFELQQDKNIYCKFKDYDGNVHKLKLYGHLCLVEKCSLKVHIGGPFCVNHTLEFYQIEFKQTSLKGLKFLGLFACRDFVKGEFIVPYFHLCQFLPGSKCDSELVPDPYSICINGELHSAIQYRCAGSLANTILNGARKDDLGRNVAKSNSGKCNAKFNRQKNSIDLIATVNIQTGQEIFVDYGKNRVEYLV